MGSTCCVGSSPTCPWHAAPGATLVLELGVDQVARRHAADARRCIGLGVRDLAGLDRVVRIELPA